MYVQDVIQALNAFWLKQGCLLWQPYHTEVGAGTSNPATFLRVLGPEPWWVAYVEPSIRPTDGRYGENPNRLQHYYQYQVILKPSPHDVQELFLQSLETLGLDLTKHDFRFVEDNWASPSLGAWGLGWEAWLDGMEILQFTYFQESGGIKLEVRACELTYGIERIAMFLQGKDNVYDLEWAPSGITYGDVYHTSEVEFCKYNFEQADTDKLFKTFDLWEDEAGRLLDEGLVSPAYDHCLRLSHVFNLLDARAAFSVTERGRFLLRCRRIAEGCAKAFIAQREDKGFPLRRVSPSRHETEELQPAPDLASSNARDTLMIEIGTEELPHSDVQAALAQAPGLVETFLKESRLTHGPIAVWVTPRRIAVQVEDIPACQEDLIKEVRGPKKAAAKDEHGELSVAARRFAEGQGLSTEDIYFKQQGKSEYCFVEVHEKGKPLGELLSDLVDKLLRGMRFAKSMGWEDSTVTFSRPVRWLLALHGRQAIPVSWKIREASDLGPERVLSSGRVTYGHRRLAPGAVTVDSASSYRSILRGCCVLADRQERMQALQERVQACCASLGLKPEDDEDLFEEICDLVEWPEPVVCTIPEEALTLPEPIIITPMKVQQWYIPLREPDGRFSKHFIAVANGDHGDEGREIIRIGNERVLHARLRDAKYFWDTDTKTSLRSFAERLSSILFHQKLGTLADKVARLRSLYERLKDQLPSVNDGEMDQVLSLIKADLVTQMVFEFDSLEGVVGMLYARNEGISEDIAQAIFEHRLPRKSGDALPSQPLGVVAGTLDRIDTITGYFGVGARVTGTRDPFGLRRNALALLSIVRAFEMDVDLEVFVRAAAEIYGPLIENPDKAVQDVLGFFSDRLAVLAREDGHAHDKVAAALATHSRRPQRFHRCLDTLDELDEGGVQALAEQAKRMARIIKEPAPTVDPSLLEEQEQAIARLVGDPACRVADLVEENEFSAACQEVLTWVPVIASYFDDVLVNHEQKRVRMNRHALLRAVLSAMTAPADFTKIEKKEVEAR